MADSETFARRASLGLELLDELTSEALVGNSTVRVFRASAPDQELTPTEFLVGLSRWVFEDLDPTEEVRLVVDADNYFSEVLETGSTAETLADPEGIDIPSVVTDPDGSKFVSVRLRPRTGYPFPNALTRVVGSVLFGGSPVVGATVAVTPRYGTSSSSTPGTPVFHTLTADDGQFVAWLFPNSTQDPPAPVAYDADATDGTHIGNVADQALLSQTINGVVITLA
jgi:hypothetical protein